MSCKLVPQLMSLMKMHKDCPNATANHPCGPCGVLQSGKIGKAMPRSVHLSRICGPYVLGIVDALLNALTCVVGVSKPASASPKSRGSNGGRS